MSISREAIEAAYSAACQAIRGTEAGSCIGVGELDRVVIAALTAALPHLAPKPSQSDEALLRQSYARSLSCDEISDNIWDEAVRRGVVTEMSIRHMLSALAVVRAEATLAEREACAKLADDYDDFAGDAIAAAIRARTPMSDIKGEKIKQPPECDTSTKCPNIECTYEGYDKETWHCETCGEHFNLYYEDMK